jgi:hypothetical protein
MKIKHPITVFAGIDQGVPAHEVQVNATPDSDAVWSLRGRLQRIYGKEKNSATQLDGDGILKQAIFIDGSQNEYGVAITNTKAYKKDGTSYTSIQGSTDFTSTVDIIDCESFFDSTGTETFIISNLTDGMKKWTGAGNIADLDGSPPKAKILAAYRGYLLALNVSESGQADPRKARFSALFNGESWPAENYFYMKQSSDAIIAADIIRDRLAIYKEKSISMLDYIGGSLIFDLVENYVNSIGAASREAVVRWGEDGEKHFILGQDTKIYAFDGIDNIHISRRIDPILENINPTYKGKISSVAAPDISKIIWAVPLGDDTTCKTLIIYDVVENSFWVKYSEAIAVTSFGKSKLESTLTWEDLPYPSWDSWDWSSWDSRTAVANVPTILIGGVDGYVRRFTEGLDDDGNDISSYYMYGFDNLDGSDWTIKTVNRIFFELKARSSGTLKIEIFTDNNSVAAVEINEDSESSKFIPLYGDDINKSYIVYAFDSIFDCFNVAVKISSTSGAWSGKVMGFDFEVTSDRVINVDDEILTFGSEQLTFGDDVITF